MRRNYVLAGPSDEVANGGQDRDLASFSKVQLQ